MTNTTWSDPNDDIHPEFTTFTLRADSSLEVSCAIDKSVTLEEEMLADFSHGQFFPVDIGSVYASKYQVVGKLGFGTTATVWSHDYVALKVYTKDDGHQDEFQTLQTIVSANPSHPGHRNVQAPLDPIKLQGSRGHQFCLVLKPMWESCKQLLRQNASARFDVPLLKAGLRHLFIALDYLHTDCKLVHTDIKVDNILHDIKDQGILDSFVKAEVDTGQIWEIFQGCHLFHGQDPDGQGYSTRVHLAEVIAALGPPPLNLLRRGARSHEFFSEHGKSPAGLEALALVLTIIRLEGRLVATLDIPPHRSLESRVLFLMGEEKTAFLNLLGGMLQWRPEDRKTARQLAQDPWINS